MASNYKTPGVYVEEISKFPPSVAQVETAIPAFVGYTEKAVVDGEDYHDKKIIRPIKISSLPDYEFLFGGAPEPTTVNVELNADNSVKHVTVNGINLLYDSVRMFYANGGGDCYIVSVGGYNSDKSGINKDELINGLNSLQKVDLPTLLVIPESVHLDVDKAGEIHAAMLAQCNKLQDRFAVLDIVGGDKDISPTYNPLDEFRNNVGMSYLKYGAAYYPWIKTTLSYKVDYNTVIGGSYSKDGSAITDIKAFFNAEVLDSIAKIDADIAALNGISVPPITSISDRSDLKSYAEDLYEYFEDFFDLTLTDATAGGFAATNHQNLIKEGSDFHKLLTLLYDYNYHSENPTWSQKLLDATTHDFSSFTPLVFTDPSNDDNDIYTVTIKLASHAAPYFQAIQSKLENLISEFVNELNAERKRRTDVLGEVDAVYKGIYNAILNQGVVLPPSGAIVGVYAMVDNDRGVWKAPANVSLTAVKGPAVNITHDEQGSMNIDVNAGKSINAIRAFTGKGTLIWGARTLAGNDNEWRYVSVRRFFNMVEESVKKATERFVFEPNDANTWVKVRAMIENFLSLQWRAGALAGAKADQAFYVRVGLGQTMTAFDILEGRMNVEIGMAVVRPAEFIILKFSHKMQES